jgi:hypothetical protein
MKRFFLRSIIFFSILWAVSGWTATVPSTMNYQGYLANSSGKPLPDGAYGMTFGIYQEPAGGAAVWTEVWSGDNMISLVNGRFNVNLGSIVPLPAFDDRPYYLEIEVASYGTLSPRLTFAAVPYANRAGNIDAMSALSGDVVGTTDAQVLTNKTMEQSMLDGGTIDGTVIGSTRAAEGTFTALTAGGDLTVQGRIQCRAIIDAAEKTANYTMTATDDIILADTSSGVVVITLSTATGNPGRSCMIKLKTAGNILLIAPAGGETINNIGSLQLRSAGSAVRLVSDGSNWNLVDEVGSVSQATGSDIDADLLVGGSECIGFDCINGETFSADTLKLKENNLRIYFNDTSSTASFPANDWRITANDSSNGGRSYFSIDDATGGNSAVLVAPGGRVGIATADLPQGKLDVNTTVAVSGTGTVSTNEVARLGTISTAPEMMYIGTISSTGTMVTGNNTYFLDRLYVGLEITAAGETRTITSIASNTEMAVDTAWSSDLTNELCAFQGSNVTGTGTAFTSEVTVHGEITAGGEIKKIYQVYSDTQLYTYGTWSADLSGESYTVPGNILTGSGTAFTTEVSVGYMIAVGGEQKRITAINSDTELEVDSLYERFLADEAFAHTKTGLLVAEDGRVGIGTTTPDQTFEIEVAPAADIEIGRGTTEPGRTFFTLRSPNGTKFNIPVADDGGIAPTTIAP